MPLTPRHRTRLTVTTGLCVVAVLASGCGAGEEPSTGSGDLDDVDYPGPQGPSFLGTPRSTPPPPPEPEPSPTADDIDWAEQWNRQQHEELYEGRQDPAEDMTEETYREWGDYDVVSESELEFFLITGDPECYGLRYVVEETEDDVAVALIHGTRDGAPSECPDSAHYVSILVELDEPLGDREVVEWEEFDWPSGVVGRSG
ncbi:hypothetical protein [Nesterenkonia alba]|uniref:hypothetical protein n=1 Tax=Nesterenkonia alba TaxID=515814 RepID=UPI0003B7AD29|nr:hypothetical protein [Nesterenkonia alba]